jgi:hypothetical protein
MEGRRLIKMEVITKERENINESYRNLEEILEKGIEPKDLVAVRAIFDDNLNQDGERMYAGPFRPTIHFSLNHMFKINPIYGKWDNSNTVILLPFEELVENNKRNFYGGSTVDVFCVGYAKLPSYEMVKCEGEDSERFIRKVEGKIKEMGYKVLPPGDWAWGGSWKATEQFDELLREMGPYLFGAHTHTIFHTTDEIAQGVFGYDWKNKETHINPPDCSDERFENLKKRYILELYQSSGLDIPREKDGKLIYPDLDEVCQTLNTYGIKFEEFPEWVHRNLKENGNLHYPKDNLKFNGRFFRTIWYDVFTNITENKIKQLKRSFATHVYKAKTARNEWIKLKNNRKNGNQFEGKRYHNDYVKNLRESKRYRDTIKMYSTFSERFSPFLNQWMSYWGKKEGYIARHKH